MRQQDNSFGEKCLKSRITFHNNLNRNYMSNSDQNVLKKFISSFDFVDKTILLVRKCLKSREEENVPTSLLESGKRRPSPEECNKIFLEGPVNHPRKQHKNVKNHPQETFF